jgi:hypothetical protein
MKNLYFSKGLVVLLVAVLSWVSCRKETSQDTPGTPANFTEQRAAGLVPDDPIAASKVPLIVSANFLMQNQQSEDYLSGSARGKPIRFDATPPTISITSPANGSSVNGTINITVNANDNNKVALVSLSIDGGIAAISSNKAPFTNTWNSGTVSNGSHTLYVTASDASGNKATSSIQVVVDNARQVILPLRL